MPISPKPHPSTSTDTEQGDEWAETILREEYRSLQSEAEEEDWALIARLTDKD